MFWQQIDQKIQKSFSLSVLVFLSVTFFSYAENLKGYFIKQNTFLYLYLNTEKVRVSKIYASVDKYLIQNNWKEYSKLCTAAEKIGIRKKDISEIYFTSSLKTDKAAITQENIYYLSGIVLKKDITIEKLFSVLEEFLKNEPSVKLGKIKKNSNEIIQIQSQAGSIYIILHQPKLILTGSDLSNLITFLDSYKKIRTAEPSSPNMTRLLSQISSSASLYAVITIPPFVLREFQQISNKIERDEQQDVKCKINNIIRNLNGLTIETKTDDALILKVNTFFATQNGAKSFNELTNQFMPLLKFQLFMMVQNSTLPVLNTITVGMKNNSVSLSGILTSDDFVSLNQMIKKTKGDFCNINRL